MFRASTHARTVSSGLSRSGSSVVDEVVGSVGAGEVDSGGAKSGSGSSLQPAQATATSTASAASGVRFTDRSFPRCNGRYRALRTPGSRVLLPVDYPE